MGSKKILVTGGAGFVGSNLVDRLIKEGYSVAVIDNLSTGKKKYLNSKAKFYKSDIRDSKIEEVFKKENPEIVFHCAAEINVRKSTESPERNADINILGSLNILENCKKKKVKKFVFPSSVGIYGEPQSLPVDEDHPLGPMSPYTIGKLAVEKYLYYYQKQGLDFVILRYSNIFGPRQSEEGVIPIFIKKILRDQSPIIFGDGTQTRDFLYIEDAVSAAMESLRAPGGSVYNVATNKEISIKEVSEMISEILDKKIEPKFESRHKGEIIRSRIDYSKIEKELGWEPEYSFRQGLKETIHWYKEAL